MKTEECLKENWSAKGNYYRSRYIHCGTVELNLWQILLYHMAILVFTIFNKSFIFSNKSTAENTVQFKLKNGGTKQVWLFR